ncbi:MAG TPA: cysteine--tRNA ligase [Patescibacteria group bacterium]
MKLYNTMSRQVEEFVPLQDKKVGLYACGFTVYDFTHLGHLRKYTMDDVLIRTLRHAGYEVTFVQNVTDVGHLASDADTGEDKLEKGAKKYHKSVWDVAREFEEYFWRSMDLMGNLRPDHSTRATEYIAEQIELVKTLEAKGYTYIIDGDGVYFDTSKLDDYGALARLDIEHLKEGARVETVPGKRNPTDFALWKFERPGEDRAMSWPSPWSERGFPGWHIECSAMAMAKIGPQLDVHTGGIDHIPVHHANEIAQSEAATGKKPFVKYWVHHNFLQIEGEKMSKSLGNFYTIDDILQRNFDPMALRLLFLTGHYRSEMNFTWAALEGSQKTWNRLKTKVMELHAAGGPETEASAQSTSPSTGEQDYLTRFFEAMENDLHTSEALAVMWQVLKDETLSNQEKLRLLYQFDQVLGLGLEKLEADEAGSIETKTLPAAVQKLIADRQRARDDKNWQRADELRDELYSLGYKVEDTESGQKVTH